MPWLPPVEITDPGPTGQRVNQRGIFANYFPARSGQRGPAVLLLGGSEGGIGRLITKDALDLQRRGVSVLTPGYFAVPRQPKHLVGVPLETFDRALAWLRSRPDVDPARVSIMGTSKGAEAALLVATRHPELGAVVAGVPSSVVWPGINYRTFRAGSSWTLHGRPLPMLPYGRLRPSFFLGHVDTVYTGGLRHLRDHPASVIPVERIGAPVLLVCGEDDKLWPSCEMARQVQARAYQRGGPRVTVLAFADAGHESVGAPLDPKSSEFRQLSRWGGSTRGNNAARAASWSKVVELLGL